MTDAGRAVAAPGDDGRPDRRLAAALLAYDSTPASLGEVLAALAGARVFLALAARAAGEGDASAQLSLLGLTGTGGRAMPVFVDGRDVQRWRPEARPVPVLGPLACATALEDGADALLLDPAGAAVQVPGGWLGELAAGRVPVTGSAATGQRGPGLSTWHSTGALAEPVAPDTGLLASLAVALAPEPVLAARLLTGPDGCPVVAVTPRRSLSVVDTADLAYRVRSRLGSALPASGLDLMLAPAEGPGARVPLPRGRWWRRR